MVTGRRATTGCCVAAAGTTTRGTCVRRTATTTSPATGTTTLASAVLKLKTELDGSDLNRPVSSPSDDGEKKSAPGVLVAKQQKLGERSPVRSYLIGKHHS